MLTWCRSAVNRASLPVAAIRRTRPRSLSAPCPALGPGRVSLVAFPLADPLPSTTSAAPPWTLFGSRVAGSISAPGSHGSRRDTLASPGSSHQPSVRADPLPVGEQTGLAFLQPGPPPLEPFEGPQPPILLPSPAPQVGVDALQEGIHHGPVIATVIVHPSDDDGV